MPENKRLKPEEVDFVIYHHPCSDGTAAAFCCWKFMSVKGFQQKHVTYYPFVHGSTRPNVTGKNVLMLDTSLPYDQTLQMIKEANSFLIIDHHISAKKNLQNLDGSKKIFDMNHSAAVLSWVYFFPNTEVPLMLKLIEDRDIWKKEMPFSDEFAAWFYNLPFDFEEYNKYLDKDLLEKMIQTKGVIYQELNNKYIEQAINFAIPKFVKIRDKFYFVTHVNSTILKSEIGNQIFDRYPLCDFSCVYSIKDNNNSTIFSLRSTDERTDVSEIATLYHGGGHRNASGIRLEGLKNNIGICYDTGGGVLYNLLSNIYSKEIEFLLPWQNVRKKYNIVYLNSPTLQSKLGKYLLQGKVNHNQNANYILNYINKSDCKNHYSFAAVWHFDSNENKTIFQLCIDTNLQKDDAVLVEKLKLKYKSNKIQFDGLCSELNTLF